MNSLPDQLYKRLYRSLLRANEEAVELIDERKYRKARQLLVNASVHAEDEDPDARLYFPPDPIEIGFIPDKILGIKLLELDD